MIVFFQVLLHCRVGHSPRYHRCMPLPPLANGNETRSGNLHDRMINTTAIITGVYYLSVAAAGFLVFIIVLAIIKYILFVLLFILTGGKLKLWIFPNLTEDVGFFESFVPAYVYTYDKPKKDKESDDEESSEEEEEEEKGEENEGILCQYWLTDAPVVNTIRGCHVI